MGLAVADEETRVALPFDVIDARSVDPVARLAELAREREASVIVVGRPVGLSGREGPAVQVQREFLLRLRAAVSIPVEEFDERLTTVIAEKGLRARGTSPGIRAKVRDAVAAQLMLQDYLDTEEHRRATEDKG
ncbi:MAG: Holliday junction resolvase RuvX [Actinomycetota bacterium]|nr:Holliday junction resolvase RuvX [Actinomycetota bacterium]